MDSLTVVPGNASLLVSWTAPHGTVSGYKVQWKSGSQGWDATRQSGVTTTADTITGLTNGVTYTVRVTAYNDTGDGPGREAAGTPGPALTASAVGAGTATLTITNHTGDWYWKYTTPSGGQCSTKAGGATASLTGLDAGTSYTFKAYSDVGCAAALTGDGTDADFLTRPAQVTGLKLTPGKGALAVGWAETTGTVTGYKVQWKSGNQDWSATRQRTVTGRATTAATITNLTSGAGYAVRVTAYNATGDGAPSAEASATPAAATLTAGKVQAGTATLTLAGHVGAWYYKYTRPTTPADTCSTQVDGGTTTVDLTDLSPGTHYIFKAYSDAGCATEITTDATDAYLLTRPGQVTGVTIAPGNMPHAPSLAVSWTAVSGPSLLTAYRVQWRSDGQSWDATRQRTVTGRTTTAATITGLVNDTTYRVRVIAYNATGDGAPSVVTVGTPSATTPAQPTGLTVGEGDAAVTVSWTAGADGGATVTGWEVQYKAGSGGWGAWTTIPDAGLGTRRHTVTKLANGVVHRFRVRAVNGVGAGAASAESPAATPTVFCGRTPAVRDAIVAKVPGKTTCSAVTTTDLAAVTGKLDFKDRRIGSLRAGDFAGLGGVTQLDLAGNALSRLPAGIFDPLTALTSLDLRRK